MTLYQKGVCGLKRTLDRVSRLLAGKAGTSSKPARRRRASFRPAFDQLESRELLTANMAIGMNLENVRDYMAGWMFTDAFKESKPWMSQDVNMATGAWTTNTAETVHVDANGWATSLNDTVNPQGQEVQQVLSTLMLDHLNGHYAAGTYTAEWDGTCTVWWGGDVTVSQTGMTADGHHYALLSDPNPGNGGIQMTIRRMSAADPIRNVHVWLPDYNGQSFVGQDWHPGDSYSPFHPLFLQQLQGVDGTLRMMQLQETITSQVVHWSDRRSIDYETQMTDNTSFQNGIAPEYMIEMANELHSNLWINVPHMAQSDYITNLATMIRDNLNPDLKVYVEWSNEVWNGAPGFVPHQWIMQQLALPQNAGTDFFHFVASQERNAFDTFSPVFTGQTDRMVRVVAGFEQNPWYTSHLLAAMNGDFDAVAIGAYFGPSSQQTASYTASTTETQIMDDTSAAIPTDLAFLQRHKQLADQYAQALGRPIQLLAYEGGPSEIGGHQPWAAAMNATADDPRMHDAFLQWLNACNQVGFSDFNNYVYTNRESSNTPWGNFGALAYQGETAASAPKYRALLDYVMSTQAPATTPTVSPATPTPSAPAVPAPSTGASVPVQSTTTAAQTLPVLMVIGDNFQYQEYHDTRQSLEAAGLRVTVAAVSRTAVHYRTQTGDGTVTPDIAITDAHAADYSAIVFIGGYGASEYQYAFPGTYQNPVYNTSAAVKAAANQLINDFVAEGKYVTAICHGVSVLAWSRVNGQSLLAGHEVAAYEGSAPAFSLDGGRTYQTPLDHWNEDQNGATVFAPGSIGDPRTSADDVYVDGKIITAQNQNSARLFGQVIAQHLLQ